jgi:hypothetical protein
MTWTHETPVAKAEVAPPPGNTPAHCRPASLVMSPARAGAAVPTPLSFARSFVRRMTQNGWRVERVRFDLDGEGRGEALYRLDAGGRQFHFPVNSDFFPQDQKVDRSFGINWDASAALCQGPWDEDREARLRPEITLQYLGRYDPDTLCFTRGNRSERIFDEVVAALASGRQPDPAALAPVGYIFRTTAFAGNGLFGMRPYDGLDAGHPLRAPYHVQMAAAYLLREFVFDLAEHLARARAPGAVALDRRLKRYLGLGNSAGQGLIPFILNHPHLIHRWTLALEKARADAGARRVDAASHALFLTLLDKSIRYFREDPRDGNGIFLDYAELARQLAAARDSIAAINGGSTWNELVDAALAGSHPETAEVLGAILIEIQPDIVTRHENTFHGEETFSIRPEMTVGTLHGIVRKAYAWALEGRLPRPAWTENFWYQPVEAPDEPRRGRRGIAPGFEYESRMDVPRQIGELDETLASADPETSIGEILAVHPHLRHIVRRVQSVGALDYAEFRDSTIAADYTPFAAERFLLTFYGMEKLDPRPPRSVKGAFLQGAPTAADIEEGVGGDWPFPLIPDIDAGDRHAGARAPLRLLESPEQLPSTIRNLPMRRVATRAPHAHIPFFAIEYRKLVIRALLVAGLPLGLAEDLTEWGEQTDALEPDRGLTALLGIIDRLGHAVFRRPGREDIGTVPLLRCDGVPGLVHLPAALDVALARARRSAPHVGCALIDDPHGGALFAGAAACVARNGTMILIAARDADRVAGAIAWHGAAGTSLATIAAWPPELRAILRGTPVDAALALGRNGILVASIDPRAAAYARLVAFGMSLPSLWSPTCLTAAEARTRSEGFVMTAERFGTLERIAKRWLIPDGIEPRLALHPPPQAGTVPLSMPV